MKKKYYAVLIFLLLNMSVLLLCKALFHSYTPDVILIVLESVSLVVLFGCNRIVRNSHWFRGLHADPEHERYPDNIWYRKHDERNFDLINLGSNSAKYAFNYTEEPVRAMNWSSGSQTLIDDYKLMRNFHSILKERGTVIITIMPFTSINKQTGLTDAFKFWKVLDYTQTAPQYRRKCRILEHFPIFFGMAAVKTIVKVVIGRDGRAADEADTDMNPMSEDMLKAHAARVIAAWKQEFSIDSLEEPLTNRNHEGREIRIAVMRNLLDFIEERGYRPVFVIPPVSSYLKEYFTDAFQKIYIYSYLKQIERSVPILDYMKGDEYDDKGLYFNSYYLNSRGARIFTHRVMTDLTEMELL